MDFVSLAHPFLEADQKVVILWLDDHYCLLSFPAESCCTRMLEAWRSEHEKEPVDGCVTMQKVKLERYDAFERLCGMNVACAEKPASRKRDREESVIFENKRLRILKVKRHEGEKSRCNILSWVCFNKEGN